MAQILSTRTIAGGIASFPTGTRSDADSKPRNPALMAWDHVLSNSLSAEQEYIVGSLFCNSDYLETQGFTTLHKTVIGLVHRELGVELRCSISDIDAQDANGRTPLFWATRRGDVDAVQLLLDYGANVSIADNQGYMPIHEASTVACARVLLSKSVQVMSRNTWGRTALHQACERGEDAALLDVLISAGADVDATDATGETPLHTTIVHERTGHPRTEHAARLMRAGADSSITNLSGDSPLRFAMMFGTHEILKDMVKYHTDFSDVKHIFGHTFAHSIARSADVQTLQCLQNAKGLVLDLEALDKSGKTALDYVQQRSEDPTLVAAFDQLVRATTRASTDTQRVGENLEIGAVKVEPVVSMIELNEAAVSIEDVGDSNSVIYHDAMEDLGTTLSSDASVEVAAA